MSHPFSLIIWSVLLSCHGPSKTGQLPTLGIRATFRIQCFWSLHRSGMWGSKRGGLGLLFVAPFQISPFLWNNLIKRPSKSAPIIGHSLRVSSIQKLFIGARSVGEKGKLTLPLYSRLPVTQILNTLGICSLETYSHLTFAHF